MLGAFLTLASNLHDVVTRWTQKVQVVFYLEDDIEDRVRESLQEPSRRRRRGRRALVREPGRGPRPISRALPRPAHPPDDLGENPFPASLEVSLRADHQSPREVQRLVHDFERAPGVQEVQYDLLWIERLATAVRLVRGVGLFLGGILAARGSLHDLQRHPPHHLRARGRARHHAAGGGDPGLRARALRHGRDDPGRAWWARSPLGCLALALRLLARDLATASEVLGRASIGLPAGLGPVLVVGGMLVGVAGSLISLGRLRV